MQPSASYAAEDAVVKRAADRAGYAANVAGHVAVRAAADADHADHADHADEGADADEASYPSDLSAPEDAGDTRYACC